MKETIELTKINEVYYLVDAYSGGVLEELKDYFRFRPPSYKFMPAFKNGFWDGYVNLFDPKNRMFYVGLRDYMDIFGKEHNYDIVYKENDTRKELTSEVINDFIEN